ncbi:hypothetical protein HanRHA438_Chr17g0802311 [Helianthus annuus]|nr:hypothetical protein HanRHA438_Chr17g0802311 [Helianthus annuus]
MSTVPVRYRTGTVPVFIGVLPVNSSTDTEKREKWVPDYRYRIYPVRYPIPNAHPYV